MVNIYIYMVNVKPKTWESYGFINQIWVGIPKKSHGFHWNPLEIVSPYIFRCWNGDPGPEASALDPEDPAIRELQDTIQRLEGRRDSWGWVVLMDPKASLGFDRDMALIALNVNLGSTWLMNCGACMCLPQIVIAMATEMVPPMKLLELRCEFWHLAPGGAER